MSDDVKMSFTGDDQLSPVINKINKSLDEFDKEAAKADKSGDAVSSAFKKIGTAAVAYIAVQKIGDALKYSVEQAFEAQKVDAKLEQTIKATGSAAGLTSTQLKDMASRLQSVTTFGDETIKSGQAMLLTFKNIGGNIFPRVTEAMLDMSEAMGQDVTSTAMQMGKALNDPIEGVSALSRVGVQFTDAQKDMIKQMVEMNDIASAQNIILKELESQFGGVARAVAETDAGQIQQLKNAFDDLAQAIGEKLVPVLMPAANGLKELLTIGSDAKAAKDLANKWGEVYETTVKIKQIEEEIAVFANAPALTSQAEERFADKIEELDNLKAKLIELQNVASGKPATGATPALIAAPKKKEKEGKKVNPEDVPYIEKYGMTKAAFDKEMRASDEAFLAEIVKNGNDAYKLNLDIAMKDAELQAQQHDLRLRFQEEWKNAQLTTQEIIINQMDATSDKISEISGIINQNVSNVSSFINQMISEEEERKKENVKTSKMTEKQKQEALLAIEEEARKKRYKIAIADWINQIMMSQANTALAVTKTMATMGYPVGIPFAIAAAATGAVSTTLIAASKPRYEQGGFIGGVSYTGDKVDARVNSGEAVLNVQQQREFMAIANGRSRNGGGNITVGETTVIINGNATDETVQALRNENMNQQERILEMLYDAKDRGMIDTTRLTI
jgi:hypothetical protein